MIHQKARRQWVEQRDENIEICCGIILMKLWDWFRHYICHFIGVKYLCNFLHSLQQRLYELPCSSGVKYEQKQISRNRAFVFCYLFTNLASNWLENCHIIREFGLTWFSYPWEVSTLALDRVIRVLAGKKNKFGQWAPTG